jgi:hypothetical protein
VGGWPQDSSHSLRPQLDSYPTPSICWKHLKWFYFHLPPTFFSPPLSSSSPYFLPSTFSRLFKCSYFLFLPRLASLQTTLWGFYPTKCTCAQNILWFFPMLIHHGWESWKWPTPFLGEIKLREIKTIKFTDPNKMNINAERINKPVKIKTRSRSTKMINSLSYINYSWVRNFNWALVHLQSYAEHNSKTTTQTYKFFEMGLIYSPPLLIFFFNFFFLKKHSTTKLG